MKKETLDDFIKSNKLGFYNSNPRSEPHPLSKLYISQFCMIVIVIALSVNLVKRKLKVVVLDQ